MTVLQIVQFRRELETTRNATTENQSKSNMTSIDLERPIAWKSFQNDNGLLTMNHPSNWIPEDLSNAIPPINVRIEYQGKISDDPEAYFYVTDYKEDYVNSSRDLLNRALDYYKDTTDNFKLTGPVDCQKYNISGINACSAIISSIEPMVGPKTSLYVMAANVNSFRVSFRVSYAV
jgi:hypothetical protein